MLTTSHIKAALAELRRALSRHLNPRNGTFIGTLGPGVWNSATHLRDTLIDIRKTALDVSKEIEEHFDTVSIQYQCLGDEAFNTASYLTEVLEACEEKKEMPNLFRVCSVKVHLHTLLCKLKSERCGVEKLIQMRRDLYTRATER